MHRIPKRIVLSRKGFDTTYGGCASPIFKDGEMMSLPIPENSSHTKVRTTFEMLRGKQARNIPSAIEQLCPARYADLPKKVHLDPDLRPLLRRKNQSNSKGYFGQCGGSQAGLKSGGVCDPNNHSLFLFYGWFRGVEEENDGGLRYIRAEANKPMSQNQHVIWGWLQVKTQYEIRENQALPPELEFADHHPHIEHRDRKNNFLYEGMSRLTFDNNKLGSGIFPRYHADLRLTCPDEFNRMSYWRVPPFLRSAATGGVNTQWKKQCSNAQSLRYQGPGQEFIFNTEGCQNETADWLTKLFRHAENFQ